MSTSIQRSLASLCLLAATACGASGPSGGALPTDESPTSVPPASMTLEGTVRPGVEVGCLVVRLDGETYLLVGAGADDLAAGQRVRLVGTTEPDIATSCMQGVPFQVRSVELLP